MECESMLECQEMSNTKDTENAIFMTPSLPVARSVVTRNQSASKIHVSPLLDKSPWIDFGRRSSGKKRKSMSEERPQKSDLSTMFDDIPDDSTSPIHEILARKVKSAQDLDFDVETELELNPPKQIRLDSQFDAIAEEQENEDKNNNTEEKMEDDKNDENNKEIVEETLMKIPIMDPIFPLSSVVAKICGTRVGSPVKEQDQVDAVDAMAMSGVKVDEEAGMEEGGLNGKYLPGTLTEPQLEWCPSDEETTTSELMKSAEINPDPGKLIFRSTCCILPGSHFPQIIQTISSMSEC